MADGYVGQDLLLRVQLPLNYAGLATIGYTLYKGDGTEFQARTTTNVTEIGGSEAAAYYVTVAGAVVTTDLKRVEWDDATTLIGSGDEINIGDPSSSAPTVQNIVDGVWDELIAGHLGAGSTGEALNDAGASGDPWLTILPGTYTGDQAGAILPATKKRGSS